MRLLNGSQLLSHDIPNHFLYFETIIIPSSEETTYHVESVQMPDTANFLQLGENIGEINSLRSLRQHFQTCSCMIYTINKTTVQKYVVNSIKA